MEIAANMLDPDPSWKRRGLGKGFTSLLLGDIVKMEDRQDGWFVKFLRNDTPIQMQSNRRKAVKQEFRFPTRYDADTVAELIALLTGVTLQRLGKWTPSTPYTAYKVVVA